MCEFDIHKYEYTSSIEARSHNFYCCGKAINITYSVCMSSLIYPACSAHALYHIFPHYLMNSTIFGKKEKKIVF